VQSLCSILAIGDVGSLRKVEPQVAVIVEAINVGRDAEEVEEELLRGVSSVGGMVGGRWEGGVGKAGRRWGWCKELSIAGGQHRLGDWN